VAEIWEHIALDNPRAATDFIEGLEEQISTLENFPERCPRIPESELLGVTYRHLLYGNYRTIFKAVDNSVIIMRVLHGARLLQQNMLDG